MEKTIFISGGSKGIGLAIAQKFYGEGFTVIICARGQEGLAKAQKEMPGLHTYVCDISDQKAVSHLCTEILQKFGGVEVLVNNGGIYQPGAIHDATAEAYQKMMQTNVDSVFYFTRGLLPPMKTKRKGTIINLASIASLQAYPDSGLYSLSKFALLGMARNLRQELKSYHIRVITLLPGAVKTPSWDHLTLPDERFIPASDIANLVWTSYALSDRTVVEEILVRPLAGDV